MGIFRRTSLLSELERHGISMLVGALLPVLLLMSACVHSPEVTVRVKRGSHLQGPVLVVDPVVRCGDLSHPERMVLPVLSRQMADLTSRAIALRPFMKDLPDYGEFPEHLIKMSARASEDGRMTSMTDVSWTMTFLGRLASLPDRVKEILEKRSMEPVRPRLVMAAALTCSGRSFSGSLRWNLETVLVDALSQQVLWRYSDTFSSTANETGSTEQSLLRVHRAVMRLLRDVTISGTYEYLHSAQGAPATNDATHTTSGSVAGPSVR